MKQLFKISLILVIMFGPSGVMAQSKSGVPGQGVRLSAGVETGVPVGNFANGTKWNIGGSVQADFNVVKRVLFVTANAGYNHFFTENDARGDIQLIPVKAGLKYFPVGKFYVQGEAGASFLANKSKIDADKSASFVYAPQVGYLIRLGKSSYLDAGIRFESNSKLYNNGNRANFLGLRVAYAFDTK